MADYLPIIIVLMIISALLREDAVLTILYLLVGAYLMARWWTRRVMGALKVQRHFTRRVFPGETIPVDLEIANRSLLPLVWLQAHESLPVDMATPNFQRGVFSLGSRGRSGLHYELYARRRGYYPIGPLFLKSGDLFGILSEDERVKPADYLIVYPQVVPLANVGLPSQSPFGTLKHARPIFEDPARTFGKRDYHAGDSLRRVDWKATAATGRMQVKLFEASIALETAILLNLNKDEYDWRHRYYATELAIVVAASIANWVVGQKQAVGLAANGLDPLTASQEIPSVPPRKGRGQLMRILEVLASIQPGDALPYLRLVREQGLQLAWGTTAVLITSGLTPPLADEALQMRRRGLNPVIILVGVPVSLGETHRKLEHFGVPLYQISDEKKLDLWRR